MKRNIFYIENYNGVKIYQYDDTKEYTTNIYSVTFIDNNLNIIKIKIDDAINKHKKHFLNDLDY